MARQRYKQSISLIILLLFSTLVITGCGRLARLTPSKEILRSSVKLDNKRYLPLLQACSYYDLAWEWDAFSKIITLKKLNLEIRLYLGSSLVSYNNNIKQLDAPVRMHKGLIVVPVSFTQLFLEERKEPTVAREKAKKRFTIKTIVIDPGHGGKDPGAIGRSNLYEKKVVLDVSQRLKKILASKDINVILTRDEDIFIPLEQRFQIANKAKADFFISVHANAIRSQSIEGFEAYYLSTDYDDFAKAVQVRENAVIKFEEGTDYEYSKDLNATLWDMILNENRVESIEMAYFISGELKRIVKLKTRHIKGAMFYVLKGARTPALLLELGYLTNRTECARLANPHYRQMLAEAIASGIMQYRKRFEQTNGFTR